MGKRFTFLELFAGLAGLTLAVGRLGSLFTALSPNDSLYGDDMSDPDEFARIVRVLESEDVDWAHMAPVCRTMSAARRSDASGHVPVLRSPDKPEGWSEEAMQVNDLAERCVVIAEEQMKRGKFFSIENPKDSFIWQLKGFKRLASLEGVFLVTFDQCAYGAPWKKPTSLLTNAPWLLKENKKRGEISPRKHVILKGRVWSYKVDNWVWLTSEAAEYPSGLCEAWAQGWKDFFSKSKEDPPDEGCTVGKFNNTWVRKSHLKKKNDVPSKKQSTLR